MDKRFSREKKCLPGNRFQAKLARLQYGFEVFDLIERNGKLCVNDGVDTKRGLKACPLQLLLRPVRPYRVILDEIENNVGIDENQRLGLAAREGHDLLGAHLYRGNTAQKGESARRSFRFALAMAQQYVAHGSEFKVHRRAGFDPEQVTNLLGNRDLAFGCDCGCHLGCSNT